MTTNTSVESNLVTYQVTTPNPSMLEIFLNYLRNTSTFHLFAHLIFISMTCLFLSLSYVTAFHWSSIVEIYESANSHLKFDSNLKLNVVADNKILGILQRVMENTGGMRAYVYRYHNGLPAISGIPFFFQSNTHEVISPGTTRLLLFEQRVPTSIHSLQNLAFSKNTCFFVSNTKADKTNQNYYYFEKRNAISVLRCPIFLANDDLFGFVGIDWSDVTKKDDETIRQLRSVATELSGIVSKIKN